MNIRWNFYSITLIASLLFILVLKIQLFPNFLDIYYHLSVASGFNKAGGFVTNAFWEYAPYGRVNLYPPLFHFLLLGLIKTGLPLILIARLMDVIIFPLFLLVIWFIGRSIFNDRVAFFSTCMAAMTYSFYLCFSNFIPITLGFICGLIAFWGIERNKMLFASICLGLTFYTHIQIPYFFIIVFIIYGVLVKEKRSICAKVIFLSAVLGLPFLIYLIKNISNYNPHGMQEHFVIEASLCLVLSIFGLKKVFHQKGAYYFLLIFVIVSFLFAFFYPYRYICGQGLLGLIFISAVGIDEILNDQREKKKKLLAVILLFIFCSPSFVLTMEKEIKFVPLNSTFINILVPNQQVERPNDLCLYTKFTNEVVEIVKSNSDKNDIIYCNIPFSAAMISVMAHRANSEAMLKEINPRVVSDPIANSKVIIWFKVDGPQNRLEQIIRKYHLREIAQTQIAYVYINDACQSKVRINKPLISNKWVFLCLTGIFVLLVFLVRIK